MKEYDVVIIGSGAGANLIEDALSHNKTVAIVDKGPSGGTCLNTGCIPTKMIVVPADRVMEVREARKLGITAEIRAVDFPAIMERMRSHVGKSRDRIKAALEGAEDLDYYGGEAQFTDERTLEVNGKKVKGKAVFIAAGARPLVPAVKGIESVEYLTNESALRLTALPESLVIIGGGYIAAEFAHFFEAMGTRVMVVQRNKRLVPEEEPEVSELLRRSLGRRMQVHIDTEAIEVKQTGPVVTVTAQERGSGKQREFTASHLLVAAGRKPNTDNLMVVNTGVRTDEKGYIVVDEFFETSAKGVWAFGDVIGKKMFRHAANHEAELVWHNAVHGKKSRMNYLTVPHAVFSWPEIASVGLGEAEAVKLIGKQEVLVGKAMYTDVARGEAMREEEGFAKAVVHRKTGKVLGYHIIGPHASILIQEVVNAMAADGNVWSVAKGMHIHPALSEVVLKAFGKLQPVDGEHHHHHDQ
ncbi:MAG: dihydrolipoyl dehydrogenase [Nitrospirae bacterium]|nr:dihydrolipoyl dehydrogenase [Nitrospirota bacterium]NTW66517.1 dihydrolipoyl dehydrogenase [Nitrospirota bacterium]